MHDKIDSRLIGLFWFFFDVFIFLVAMFVGLLLNEAFDERHINPTPWRDDNPSVDEVWYGMTVDLFIVFIVFIVTAVVSMLAMIIFRVLWYFHIIRCDPLDKRRQG